MIINIKVVRIIDLVARVSNYEQVHLTVLLIPIGRGFKNLFVGFTDAAITCFNTFKIVIKKAFYIRLGFRNFTKLFFPSCYKS